MDQAPLNEKALLRALVADLNTLIAEAVPVSLGGTLPDALAAKLCHVVAFIEQERPDLYR